MRNHIHPKIIHSVSVRKYVSSEGMSTCVEQQASSGAPSPFAWVPLSTLGIVVELLGALLQRLGGRLSFAKECLSKGGCRRRH